MKELVRYIKFPITFDVAKLQEDISNILTQKWVDHYNTNDYSGSWTSIALMSAGGKSDNIYALPNATDTITNTEALEHCPYIQEILQQFHCSKTAVRLLRLAAGAAIKPHQDHCLGYEDGFLRLHIPVITNPQVSFILDGKKLPMLEGECWYIDANFTHSVANHGSEDRIHLVIDGIRNEWTDQMFFEQVGPDAFEKPVPKMRKEDALKMIAELQKMGTPTAMQLIADLEKDL